MTQVSLALPRKPCFPIYPATEAALLPLPWRTSFSSLLLTPGALVAPRPGFASNSPSPSPFHLPRVLHPSLSSGDVRSTCALLSSPSPAQPPSSIPGLALTGPLLAVQSSCLPPSLCPASYHTRCLVSTIRCPVYTSHSCPSPPIISWCKPPPLYQGPPRKPSPPSNSPRYLQAGKVGMGAGIVYYVRLLGLQAKASPTLPPPSSTSTVVCKAFLQKGEGPALPPPCSGRSPACRQQKPALL